MPVILDHRRSDGRLRTTLHYILTSFQLTGLTVNSDFIESFAEVESYYILNH